jgi:undecaprenyl-diphosphatase
MNKIIAWDEQLFLWLNGFHSPWLDPVMLFITKTQVWIPLFLILLYFIFKNYKAEGWLILAGVLIAILLADRLTTGLMKPYFARLRPTHEPRLEGLVHHVNEYEGGLYGFASSHAANTFAAAMLLWLIFKKIYPWIGLIFVWAAVMSYTRIYLGVHYPGDILVGMLVGLLSGWSGFEFYRWLSRLRSKRAQSTGP